MNAKPSTGPLGQKAAARSSMNRRTVMSALSSVALVPLAPNLVSAALDSPIPAMVVHLMSIDEKLRIVEEDLARAKRIGARWLERNPRPKIRKFDVGTSDQYEKWF